MRAAALLAAAPPIGCAPRRHRSSFLADEGLAPPEVCAAVIHHDPRLTLSPSAVLSGAHLRHPTHFCVTLSHFWRIAPSH